MTIRLSLALTAAALLVAALPAAAQTPAAGAPAPAPSASVVVANPTYTTIPLEIAVDRPAADVWKRVGGYCAIAEWLQIAAGCKMLSGIEGEVGSVRSVANEVLVGKTEFSYTYTQTPREGRPYNLYHGTLEVRPVTDKTSKIVYTLMYDNSMLPDDAAREKDKASRTGVFQRAMTNMKTLAEGGKLPERK
jgi:Polyketide cyclase / dehydrase and lipid transport